ncbi:hypothetical protein IV203_007504 [Nitzschia inconspicua]|uniref:Uncharacterized protein n=1 Tax=Nitzschia inconspicua TaxID=303405 RepID=A0A9K3KFM7_9STRA|nr:hypothetical protein IV203_007504 [Nitzschia inconspicua]
MPSKDERIAASTRACEASDNSAANLPLEVPEHVMTEYDILLGRGSGPNMQRGNMNLRKLVWQVYIDELRAAAPRYQGFSFTTGNDGKTSAFPLPVSAVKSRICKEVLSIIKARNGKFLKKVSLDSSQSEGSKSTADKSTVYLIRNHNYPSCYAVEVSKQEAKDKIRQALRFQMDQRPKREREIRSSTSPVESLTVCQGSSGTIRTEHVALEERLRENKDLTTMCGIGSAFAGRGSTITKISGLDASPADLKLDERPRETKDSIATSGLERTFAGRESTNAKMSGLDVSSAPMEKATNTTSIDISSLNHTNPRALSLPGYSHPHFIDHALSVLLQNANTGLPPSPLSLVQMHSRQNIPNAVNVFASLLASNGSPTQSLLMSHCANSLFRSDIAFSLPRSSSLQIPPLPVPNIFSLLSREVRGGGTKEKEKNVQE